MSTENHGPEHLPHLHTAFEDPEAQRAASSDDGEEGSDEQTCGLGIDYGLPSLDFWSHGKIGNDLSTEQTRQAWLSWVMGQEHAEPPGLKELWMERLVEVVGAGRMQGTGWKSTLSVEAHVASMLPFAYMEVCTMMVQGGALALQHVLLWTKLHYYARQDRDDFADFSTLWHSFASMFAYMLQMFDYSVLYNSTHPFMAMLLFMAYELMVAVLLLNIMIALMTSAFSRVTADEGLRYLIYKAEVIDELESTLPKWLMMRPAWYPHFVHVLKVSPRSTYEINLNSVWSGMSSLQSSLMNAQQETRLRVEALESKMDVIDQKLSATVRLLASRLVSHRELAAALSMDDDVAEASGSGSGELQRELDPDLVGEDGEPDPEHWRDADLDPAKEEQEVPEAEEGDELPLGALART
eukprot:XP_001692529.1 predicted protein [Chlamydomonas reinhardtii]